MFKEDAVTVFWYKRGRWSNKIIRSIFRWNGTLLRTRELRVKAEATFALFAGRIVAFSDCFREEASTLCVEGKNGSAFRKKASFDFS